MCRKPFKRGQAEPFASEGCGANCAAMPMRCQTQHFRAHIGASSEAHFAANFNADAIRAFAANNCAASTPSSI